MQEVKQKALARFNLDIDSLAAAPVEEAAWLQRYFDDASPDLALAMVCNLQREWLTTHRAVLMKMLAWQPANANEVAATQPVLIANTSVLHSGDSLIIRAGIETFELTSTTVVIAGDTLAPGIYQFIAKGNPGRYTIPVQFQYKPSWSTEKPDTYHKQLMYSIVP